MKFISGFLFNLSPKGRLLVFVLLIASFWILPAFWFKGLYPGISMGIIFLVLVYLTRNVWLPEDRANKSTRGIILSLISTTALTYGIWSEWLNEFTKKTLWHLIRNWADANLAKTDLIGKVAQAVPTAFPAEPAPALVFAFVLIAVYLVLRSLKSTQPMGRHPETWKAQFPKRDFEEKLANVCSLLRRHLERICDTALLALACMMILADFVYSPKSCLFYFTVIGIILLTPQKGFRISSAGSRINLALTLFLSASLVPLVLFLNWLVPMHNIHETTVKSTDNPLIPIFFVSILFIPWFSIFSSNVVRAAIKRGFSNKTTFIFYLCLAIFLFSLSKLPRWLSAVLVGIIALFVGAMMLMLIVIMVRHLINYVSDYFVYRRSIREYVRTRNQISIAWQLFKTSSFRHRYARWIERCCVKMEGDWPSGICPGTAGDSAGEILAQLDEKWLGLER